MWRRLMIMNLIEKLLTKLFDASFIGGTEGLDMTNDDIKNDLDFKGGHHTDR